MFPYHNCYKLIQRFRVTGLFTGQYNTEGYGTIIGNPGEKVSTSFNSWLLGFWRQTNQCLCFNIVAIILRPDKHNITSKVYSGFILQLNRDYIFVKLILHNIKDDPWMGHCSNNLKKKIYKARFNFKVHFFRLLEKSDYQSHLTQIISCLPPGFLPV